MQEKERFLMEVLCKSGKCTVDVRSRSGAKIDTVVVHEVNEEVITGYSLLRKNRVTYNLDKYQVRVM